MNVSSGDQAVAVAKKWIGTPYQWGGGHNGPVPVGTPVDCSGLVNQVFGISGTTYTQESMGQAVNGIASAAPGDLIFFGPLAPNEAYHVGIYSGTGMMIDAPHTGTNVRYDTVANFGQIAAIRRLVPSTAQSGPGASPSVQYTYAQLEAVWIQAGGNAQYAPMAAAIAMAESYGIVNTSNSNSNGTIDRGLWQINSTHGTGSSFDVMTNARAAVAISNNGVNWRPWCTAYSDAACGTAGGCYQCPGSPYLKFYKTGVAPDYSAPINATNAAANQPAPTGTADEVSVWSVLSCVSDPTTCIASETNNVLSGTIRAVIHSILNPIIQPIAGAMGIAAGGVLVIGGIAIMVGHTRAGGAIFSAGALAAGQPELAAGGIRGVARGQAASRRAQMITQQQGVRDVNRQAGLRQTASVRSAQRIQEMNVEAQIKNESYAFQEYLRRTRPTRPTRPGSGGTPPPRSSAIPARSTRTR